MQLTDQMTAAKIAMRRAHTFVGLSSKFLTLLLSSAVGILLIFMRLKTQFAAQDLGVDAGWFLELENQLRMGHLLGRDVYFTYGPLAQVLMSAGSLFRANDSVLNGFSIGN